MKLKTEIKQGLQAFSQGNLRDNALALLNTLGYQSEKTIDLDNTPDAFLAEFDKRDRKFRKDKALFERWKSVEFLFQITYDEVRHANVAAYEANDLFQKQQERDYATIIAAARKILDKILDEDPKHLIWYDQAITMTGG